MLEILWAELKRFRGEEGDLKEGRVTNYESNVDDHGQGYENGCKGFEFVIRSQRVFEHFQEGLCFFLAPVYLKRRFGEYCPHANVALLHIELQR